MEAYADRLDVDKIREAYEFAVEAHAGQRRASGEEYVSHTVEVATIVATLRHEMVAAPTSYGSWRD